MRSTGKKKAQAAVLLIFLVAVTTAASRLAQSQNALNWRPNKTTGGVRFVGSQACAKCHSTKVATQPKTPMGRALSSPANCEILRTHTKLTFRNGKYEYQITREGEGSAYTVIDGTGKLSVPILYCFGMGEGGQTYVLHYKDKFYESRVSFYNDIKGLDITMGHAPPPPATIEEAMGREMAMSETRSCFGCHSTNSLNGTTLQLDQLMEGVTCEACHGPGEKHVAAMQAGDYSQKLVFNPKRLSTEEVSDFCGACHRTWEDVALLNIRGVFNVRFQPYRLTNSKCYDPDDSRISCIACHDPHEGRKHDAAYYDLKCTACHSQAAKAAPAALTQSNKRVAALCRVGKANCASCHMPKYEIPGSHLKFADHHIRVVRPGDRYPN
jgi:cytochrome c554/c'-like protein